MAVDKLHAKPHLQGLAPPLMDFRTIRYFVHIGIADISWGGALGKAIGIASCLQKEVHCWLAKLKIGWRDNESAYNSTACLFWTPEDCI